MKFNIVCVCLFLLKCCTGELGLDPVINDGAQAKEEVGTVQDFHNLLMPGPQIPIEPPQSSLTDSIVSDPQTSVTPTPDKDDHSIETGEGYNSVSPIAGLSAELGDNAETQKPFDESLTPDTKIPLESPQNSLIDSDLSNKQEEAAVKPDNGPTQDSVTTDQKLESANIDPYNEVENVNTEQEHKTIENQEGILVPNFNYPINSPQNSGTDSTITDKQQQTEDFVNQHSDMLAEKTEADESIAVQNTADLTAGSASTKLEEEGKIAEAYNNFLMPGPQIPFNPTQSSLTEVDASNIQQQADIVNTVVAATTPGLITSDMEAQNELTGVNANLDNSASPANTELEGKDADNLKDMSDSYHPEIQNDDKRVPVLPVNGSYNLSGHDVNDEVPTSIEDLAQEESKKVEGPYGSIDNIDTNQGSDNEINGMESDMDKFGASDLAANDENDEGMLDKDTVIKEDEDDDYTDGKGDDDMNIGEDNTPNRENDVNNTIDLPENEDSNHNESMGIDDYDENWWLNGEEEDSIYDDDNDYGDSDLYEEDENIPDLDDIAQEVDDDDGDDDDYDYNGNDDDGYDSYDELPDKYKAIFGDGNEDTAGLVDDDDDEDDDDDDQFIEDTGDVTGTETAGTDNNSVVDDDDDDDDEDEDDNDYDDEEDILDEDQYIEDDGNVSDTDTSVSDNNYADDEDKEGNNMEGDQFIEDDGHFIGSKTTVSDGDYAYDDDDDNYGDDDDLRGDGLLAKPTLTTGMSDDSSDIVDMGENEMRTKEMTEEYQEASTFPWVLFLVLLLVAVMFITYFNRSRILKYITISKSGRRKPGDEEANLLKHEY